MNLNFPLILTISAFMSSWNFMLSWAEHEKTLITSGPGSNTLPLGHHAHPSTKLCRFWYAMYQSESIFYSNTVINICMTSTGPLGPWITFNLSDLVFYKCHSITIPLWMRLKATRIAELDPVLGQCAANADLLLFYHFFSVSFMSLSRLFQLIWDRPISSGAKNTGNQQNLACLTWPVPSSNPHQTLQWDDRVIKKQLS